ncbi:HK97 gp10 family phage protein [Paracoccus sp. MC1854]|nr:HK97 gp10 family phage protein [Paracoccus sp. MC1854]MBB1493297.1 HK97 gp10 family phage protein [Paracoccus sp. MC1854]
MKSAEEIATMQKAMVPIASGDLKNSIALMPPGQSTPAYSTPGGRFAVPELTAAVTAGNADVRYPHLVEFGERGHVIGGGWHPGAPAQPYFW